MRGQISIFDFINVNEMFDGYRVKETRTIEFNGIDYKIKKDDICYLVYQNEECATVYFPDEYGGALGAVVSKKNFRKLFENLNRKVYPKSKEIWNGKNWIANPELCVSQN